MSRFEAPPGIVTNGLVLNLDAGDPDSYTRSQPPYVEVLVVAGGGGGGSHVGGGGGAGGLIYNSAYQLTNTAAITVTIGAGGGGGAADKRGDNGSNSVFGSLTAIGGGGGGTWGGAGNPDGLNGGSGGGAAGTQGVQYATGGTGTAGQGNNGGNVGPRSGGNASGVGGGGAGAASLSRADASDPTQINGGDGLPFSILGTSYYFAGGGGGGAYSSVSGGNGGAGGGGGGASSYGTPGTGDTQSINPANNGNAGSGATGGAGAVNSGGGGGGGAGGNAGVGEAGGSGIVIVRYPGLPAATGGTITYLNGYTIHTFTSSGTFTPYLWNDVSGNGNNGTLTNGPDFIPNVNGGTFSFDGADDYVSVSNGMNALVGTNQVTFSAWIRRSSAPNYWAGIISNKINATDGISLLVNPSSKIFFQYDSTSGVYAIDGGATLEINMWYNIVGIYDNVGLKTYLNGVLNDSAADAGKSIASTGNMDIIIGAQQPLSSYFPGEIANIKIYNRGLTAAEVQQNYNAQRARFGLPYVATSGLGSSGNPATSAQQLYNNGISQDGVYYINNGTTTVPTYCEFKNGEGWMLVMNIKSDYFGDSKLTWNDYNNWINVGEDLGTVFSPFLGGQYRNRDLYNYMPNEKWMIKVHNNGSEFDGGSWAAWELIEPGNTMVTIMNTPGQSGGGTQVTNDYYAQVGMGTSGYASGLFWCPIARTLGHLRVNHLLVNNGSRILGSEQYLETSNTDRTRGLSNHYAIAGTALDNQGLAPWNSHVSPYVNTANTSPYSSNYRQFTTTVFPDSSNSNTATQGTVTLSDGRYMHYGIFIK
jgi:hypothetical protein